MARPDKEAAVAELAGEFRESNGAVLTEYRGLTVKQLQELRRSLGENARYAVAKNTLTLRAERAPKLTFGAINLTDEDPPRVRTSGGYDSKVHDPRGRMLYVKALFRF